MDNSFGARPPWTGRPAGGAYPPQAVMRGVQPGIDPRYMPDLSAHNGGQLMNGYGVGPGIRPRIATHSSGGGGYPMWDMDIPSQMFMQTVNFDRLMQQPGMVDLNTSVSTASSRHEDVSQRSEAGRDLIEQQQAMEQARLLQRFKELRQWQQQQQEVLMSQQHQQLSLLRQEQEKMQNIISKQRDNQWGGGHPNLYGTTETPPRRQIPKGADISKLMESSQDVNESKGALPRPVMYVHPKEDDDEIKTNPDLFSDTNSNRGSQAAIDDGMFPIPDSASEASVDIGMHPLRQSQVKSSVLRQRLNPHELDAPKKHHRSFAELEQDAEFMNLSSQSPTFLDVQHGKLPDERNGIIEEEAENSYEEDDDDTSDEEDESSDDDEDSSENDDDTQIEVHKDGANIDDVPIKPGIDGGKTFEELLEEQLQAEEERLREANMNQDSPSQPKRTFLKKGEGIARFDSKPGQKPHRPKKPVHKSSGSSSTKQSESHKSISNSSAQNKQAGKVSSKPPSHGKSGNKTSQKATNQTLKLLKNDVKGKKRISKPAQDTAKLTGTQDQKVEQNVGKKQSLKKSDSIPDDASFVANLKERQKESERDMEELDEFEILEQFADNMSFCSNSSIVTKGLRGLQNDRILPGVIPKSQELGRPTSPRAMLIKKLELEKQTKMKPEMDHPLKKTTKAISALELVKEGAARESDVALCQKPVEQTVVSAVDKHNNDDEDDDDEYESVSDSDSSEDLGEDKYTQGVQKKSGTDLKSYFGLSSVHDFNQGQGKNDSVCSTDKKLERVLSYTGFTETSATSESEQDLDSDSDKDSSEEDVEEKSPSKIITRKVAGRDDKNKFPFQTLPTDSEFLQVGYNSGAYAPKSKSPLVISKEKVTEVEVNHDLMREETKFSYHSDSDSVGNKHNDSFSECDESQIEDKDEHSKKTFGEKKTLQFDDEEEWGELTPKVLKSRKRQDSDGDLDKTIVDESVKEISSAVHNLPQLSDKNDGTTPPTSKLVSKLFPNLKPAQKKQEEHDLEKIQTVTQSSGGDGIQSKILRDKLLELEREIEKFRNENKHLTALRAEREQGLTKLKKEIAEFDKEKTEELKRIEEFRTEEMKKLKHEKKMFEKYQKAARAGPDKKEREEIENLKSQVAELQDEMKRKEGRWTANNSRLRDKIDQLEQENDELKEEIKLLEKKRLEWMQKDQKNKTTKGAGQLLRSSTPTDELDQLVNGHDERGFNDLSGLTTSRQNMNSKPSQHQHKTNIQTSHQPVNKSSLHSHSVSAQNKHSNMNQSSKQSVAQSNVKHNQSKKIQNTHNAKHGHSGTSYGNKAGNKSMGKSNTSVSSVKSSNDSKTMLRNSLAEDLPRRELGTIAEPQDLSMYSEADVDAPMMRHKNLPRKFASSRPGVDTSVIDKGDNDEYDEVQHSDGKVERTYRTGAREILFSNGTRKEISADGKSIVVSFFNGDVKQIMGDQRVIYYYAENQTTHTNYPDGLEIIQFPNQQTEKLYPDGTKEITFPDQTIKYIFPNGSEESVFADGTVIRLEKNGDKTMEFPNGQREVHTQEYKKREYPDGTVKTVYPDGRQETRYSNGRLRVKDKDGNVIVDRQC